MKVNKLFAEYKTVFVKFFSVGVAATLIHSIVYVIGLYLASVSAQLANLLGYLFAVTFSYYAQKNWTFEVKEKTTLMSFLRFFSASLIGFMLNAFWVFLVVTLLNMHPFYALFGIGVLTPMVTFVLLKLWVFKINSAA